MVTPVRQMINSSCDTAVEMAVGAFFGGWCARLFTTINPAHGAAFCAASVLVSKIVSPIFKEIFHAPDSNQSSKMVGLFLERTVGIIISATIATYAGFAITVAAAKTLVIAIFIARLFVKLVAILVLPKLTKLETSKAH